MDYHHGHLFGGETKTLLENEKKGTQKFVTTEFLGP